MIEGPALPRISTESTIDTSCIHGCSSTNARAPSSPSSSASVRRTMRSLRSGAPARRARTVSMTVTTPTPSSLAAIEMPRPS